MNLKKQLFQFYAQRRIHSITFFCFIFFIAPTNYAQKNLILNPGFEESQRESAYVWERTKEKLVKNGSLMRTETEKHSGKYSLLIENNAVNSALGNRGYSWSQKIMISPTDCYTFSIWMKSNLVSKSKGFLGGCMIMGYDKSGKAVQGRSSGLKLKAGVSDWKKYTIKYQPVKDVAFITVSLAFRAGLATGKIWFDDLYLGTGEEFSGNIIPKYREISPYSTPFDAEYDKAYSQIIKRKVFAAHGTPVLDGNLGDDIWKNAPLIENFLSLTPELTTFSKEKTEAKILYDEANIYFAVKHYFPGNRKLISEKLPRDSDLWTQDHIELFISPDMNVNKYYHLAVNVSGSIWDGIQQFKRSNQNKLSELRKEVNINWNPDWKAKVKRDKNSWQAEIAVPYKDLNTVPPKSNAQWNLNICVGGKGNSNSSMTVLPRMKFQDPQNFGICCFAAEKTKPGFSGRYKDMLSAYKKIKNKRHEFINSDIYKFKYAFAMVGAKNGKPRKNFCPVNVNSVYSPKQGFGWKSGKNLKKNTPLAKKINHCGCKSSLNDLTSQYIEGKEGEFIVDLPNGEYIVHIIAGDSMDVPPVFDVFAQGEKNLRISIPQNFIFNIYSFPVTVNSGQLNLSFKGEYGFLLNGLIIHKKDAGRLAEKQLRKIWEEINLGQPDWISRCQRYKYVENRQMPELTPLDKQRGYLLFTRNYLDMVYPNSVPGKKELNGKIQIWAAPGETEPAVFGLLPLKNIDDFNIKTSGFFNDRGNQIRKEDIKINIVEYKYERLGFYRSYKYMLLPSFLRPLKKLDLKKDIARQIWLNIKVPDNASPGEYKGTIELYSNGKRSGTVDLSLYVYPFKLDPLNDYTFGVFYRVSNRSPKRGIDGWSRTFSELQDMKRHNMNSVSLSVPHGRDRKNYNFGSRGQLNPQEVLKFSRLAKKAGLTKPIPYYINPFLPYNTHNAAKVFEVKKEDWTYIKSAVQEITEISRKENLPEILYWPVDEPHWFPIRIGNALNILNYFKRNINARTYMTTIKDNNNIFPLLDVIALGGGDGALDLIRNPPNQNKAIWAYNSIGSGRFNPIFAVRFISGMITWKQQIKGFHNFHYLEPYASNPFNPIDSLYAAFAYPGDEQPLPTLQWEAIREGLDDLKYLRTLEKLIEESLASNDKQTVENAGRAKIFLDKLKNEIKPSFRDYTFIHPVTGEPVIVAPAWPISKYDEIRRKIAQWIIKLTNKSRQT
ncbi:MAG: sugar-binding protein [Victivallaceae bacterium]|nr:sugar-binding protein [Victivallaceae bacterium]